VNETRDHFLADARLTRNQHPGIGPRRAIDVVIDGANDVAPADELHVP
jgi:hypothetical protein